MSSFKRFLYAIAALVLIQGVNSLLDAGSSSNIAIYWGQGESDTSLGQFCDSNPDVDVVQLAFVTELSSRGGYPKTKFARQKCDPFPGTNLESCPALGEGIKKCQNAGKTVLLSIGGATYTEGGFPSASAAINSADTFWLTFGPKAERSKHRPFGDAVVDGPRTPKHTKSRNNFYITAAPQCPFPDKNVGQVLNDVHLDAVFVQFYNNPHCGLNAFTNGSPQGFNFECWNKWAQSESKNKNVKVLIGAPASETAATNSGYVNAARLGEVVSFSKKFPSMGGVMVWDASHLAANRGLLGNVKKLADGLLDIVGGALGG